MSAGKRTPAIALLAEALILSREGFTGQGGSPQQVAESIDYLVQERIEQAVGVILRTFRDEVVNAALGRDALIMPPVDIRAELRKAWGER